MSENNDIINKQVTSRKIVEGIVVSNKMQKSVVVSISRLVKHVAYGKYIQKTKKLMAHDENNECSIGDKVKLIETKPMSANKRWKIIEILDKSI